MPFTTPPRPFTKQDVMSLMEGQNGVYGLRSTFRWVYVGKGDIRARLLGHLNGDNPCITRERPNTWYGEVYGNDPSAREKQLIAELDPVCNRKLT